MDFVVRWPRSRATDFVVREGLKEVTDCAWVWVAGDGQEGAGFVTWRSREYAAVSALQAGLVAVAGDVLRNITCEDERTDDLIVLLSLSADLRSLTYHLSYTLLLEHAHVLSR